MAKTPHNKGGRDASPSDNPARHWGGVPTGDGLFDDAVDQCGDANDRHYSADPVESSRLRILALGHEKPNPDQGDDDDGRVDQEHGSPGVIAQKPSGDQRAKREPEEGARRCEAHGAGSLLRGEHARQDGERERHDERRADTHQRPHHDERGCGCYLAGDERRYAEDGQSHKKETLAAVAVAQDARRKQEAAERERIGGRNPLEIAGAGAELRGEGRQGGDEDGRVEANDEAANDEGGERPPTARAALSGRLDVGLANLGVHGRHLLGTSHSKFLVTPKIKLPYKVVTTPPCPPPEGEGNTMGP